MYDNYNAVTIRINTKRTFEVHVQSVTRKKNAEIQEADSNSLGGN